ncbi:bifunctional (p)ppGpp synthetase/guanosine-3',5'-bis(diphosphate) 3'-pyrophosphohydrolase [Thermithiobacillus plumbiphilus]|uniref:Bifunctional (P)ppGpp synthetase/guanosine-3',5'-bis(Diphosphate) 3'-pyrophosphohydrolase n=2 Tax=Thermithiobacillus plumbiphilus TaxID=1729899 RepID=A0ABU9D8M0_9PROT
MHFIPPASENRLSSSDAALLQPPEPAHPDWHAPLLPDLQLPDPPGPQAFDALREVLGQYMEPDEVEAAYLTFVYGAMAHQGQNRRSGEPYIHHPLAVARILAELRLDLPSIQGAILHDVIEDTGVSKEELARVFGQSVADLVDGVTKLGKVHFETSEEAQAENFRKMLLAMSKDIRVVLIKLADRLHNMRTMGVMISEKRRRISRETLEIYAPIAQRLGINPIRIELEELAFAHLYPKRWHALSEAIRASRGNRKEVVTRIRAAIEERLRQEGISGEVLGREKHIYSIYQKMQKKSLSFSAVSDIYAFRIIVDSVDTCYRVLGLIHNLYKPIPGRFKDYIAIPKANGYQSLHTVLFGPFGHPIEVQIRTEDMHRVAEAGVAAHWLYKSGESSSRAQAQARAWVQHLLELQQKGGDSREFLESVKMDLFPDQVYVFTPKGKIMSLPQGATAVDFAYAVHTDIGNHCIAAKVNDQFVPLRTLLKNGDHVEIITAQSASPNPGWLDFVATGKARANIRMHLKNIQHAEAEAMGKRLLDKALRSMGGTLEAVQEQDWQRILPTFRVGSATELLEAIGMGNAYPLVVAHSLLPEQVEGEGGVPERDKTFSLSIRGTEGMAVTLARCCHPIPGDPILGFVTAGRGIVVHTHDCPNIQEWRKRRDKWVDVQWDAKVSGEYPVTIRTVVEHARGVLARLATLIAEEGSNIDHVDIEERDGLYTGITFTVDVTNRQHLARIMRALRSLPVVSRVQRLKG